MPVHLATLPLDAKLSDTAASVRLEWFFVRHPVFTIEEITAYLESRGSTNPLTRQTSLNHHLASGRLLHIRRGLYASVPTGFAPDPAQVDPLLIAGKCVPDAVVAYHAALALHGLAHSLWNEYSILTSRTPFAPFDFGGNRIRSIPTPTALRGHEDIQTQLVDRQGLSVRVTSVERTLVDCLDRPDLCGGWEEVFRSLEGIAFVSVDAVVDYTLLHHNATLAAKVGFYLSQRTDWHIEPASLERLRASRPRQPRYLDRSLGPGKLNPSWNLIVPDYLATRAWEEIGGDTEADNEQAIV